MGRKKVERDLRDAGLRKKRARKVAKAADRGRSGDRAARELVDQYASALRDSISAVVRHAKPPRSKPTRKTSSKSPAKRSPASRSTRKSSRRKARTKSS